MELVGNKLGEFVNTSRQFRFGDCFRFYLDLHVWPRSDIVKRTNMLVTVGAKKDDE